MLEYHPIAPIVVIDASSLHLRSIGTDGVVDRQAHRQRDRMIAVIDSPVEAVRKIGTIIGDAGCHLFRIRGLSHQPGCHLVLELDRLLNQMSWLLFPRPVSSSSFEEADLMLKV